MQFEFRQQTPKALANFSPWLELATTLGLQVNSSIKPCKGSAIGERFQRFALISNWVPRVVAALQAWAEISQRLRRSYSKNQTASLTFVPAEALRKNK